MQHIDYQCDKKAIRNHNPHGISFMESKGKKKEWKKSIRYCIIEIMKLLRLKDSEEGELILMWNEEIELDCLWEDDHII